MNKKDFDDFCFKCKEYPEIWYNFHYGTFTIRLNFNRRTKQYFLEWTGFNPFPQYEEFYDVVRARGFFYIKRPEQNLVEYFDIAKRCFFEHLIKVLQVYKVNI